MRRKPEKLKVLWGRSSFAFVPSVLKLFAFAAEGFNTEGTEKRKRNPDNVEKNRHLTPSRRAKTSSHFPCAFKINSITSRTAPSPLGTSRGHKMRRALYWPRRIRNGNREAHAL